MRLWLCEMWRIYYFNLFIQKVVLIENCLLAISENTIGMVELILNCCRYKWLLLFCSLKIARLFSIFFFKMSLTSRCMWWMLKFTLGWTHLGSHFQEQLLSCCLYWKHIKTQIVQKHEQAQSKAYYGTVYQPIYNYKIN